MPGFFDLCDKMRKDATLGEKTGKDGTQRDIFHAIVYTSKTGRPDRKVPGFGSGRDTYFLYKQTYFWVCLFFYDQKGGMAMHRARDMPRR